MNTESEWTHRGDRPEIEACHHMEPKVWRLRQLRRTEDSEEVAQVVTNRLLALIQAQPADASVSITWRGGRRWPGFY